MSNKPRFGGPLNKQHGKRAQALLKSASQHLDKFDWSLPSQLSWKKSLLLTCQILGLLVNTLVVDEKYPVLNREGLTIPIQMQLSQKQIFISQFFAGFLKCNLNFELFEKRHDPHRFSYFKIADSENVVRWMSKKPRFSGRFDKEHGKHAQALLKSASQHLS